MALPGSNNRNKGGQQQVVAAPNDERLKASTITVLQIYFVCQYLINVACIIGTKWPGSPLALLINVNLGAMFMLATSFLMFGFFWVKRTSVLNEK